MTPEGYRESEVSDFESAGFGDEQILWLDVSVDQPNGMGMRQGPEGFPEEIEHSIERQGAFGLDQLAEIGSVH